MACFQGFASAAAAEADAALMDGHVQGGEGLVQRLGRRGGRRGPETCTRLWDRSPGRSQGPPMLPARGGFAGSPPLLQRIGADAQPGDDPLEII